MSVQSADEGDVIRVSAVFRDDATLLPIDPDVVTLRYQKGVATVVTLTYGTDAALIKDSTGSYHADIVMDFAGGTFTYRWLSTGNGGASRWRAFPVNAAPI